MPIKREKEAEKMRMRKRQNLQPRMERSSSVCIADPASLC